MRPLLDLHTEQQLLEFARVLLLHLSATILYCFALQLSFTLSRVSDRFNLDVGGLVCETTEKTALAELDVAFLRTVGLSLVRI